MEYLLLLAAFVGFVLSYRSFMTYKKFQYSGKIPQIVSARRNKTLFLLLGLVCIFTFAVIKFLFFHSL